jgi:hypothetical protein
MRRLIATVALAVGLVAGTVGLAQPASAHTDSQANAVCDWFEVQEWGAPNYIYQLRNASVHWWGSHQALCIYDHEYGWVDGHENVCLLYDFVNGAYTIWWDCL